MKVFARLFQKAVGCSVSSKMKPSSALTRLGFIPMKPGRGRNTQDFEKVPLLVLLGLIEDQTGSSDKGEKNDE